MSTEEHPKALLSVCQPILDIKIALESDLIDNSEILSNGYITSQSLDTEHLKNLLKIHKNKVQSGGTSLNTTLCLARNFPCISVHFIGAVGDDTDSKTFTEDVEQTKNYKLHLETINGYETAKCYVFLQNNLRSLVTTIGAANKLSKNFIIRNLDAINRSETIYLSLFFISSMPKNANFIFNNLSYQILSLNLSFEGLYDTIDRYVLIAFLIRSNILIGNYSEMSAFFKFLFQKEPPIRKSETIQQIFRYRIFLIHEFLKYLSVDTEIQNMIEFDQNIEFMDIYKQFIDTLSIGSNDDRYIFQKYTSPGYSEDHNVGNFINDHLVQVPNRFAIFSTDGEDNTLYTNNGVVFSAKPLEIGLDTYDTCGAGDYFAAGVLAYSPTVFSDKIKKAVESGHTLAQENIIRNTKQNMK